MMFPPLRGHLQRGSHRVKLPPGANHDSVEPEHTRGDGHRLLCCEHQERLVLTLPSYTNLERTLNVVSCARPLNVSGESYASWRHVCFRSSCVYAL